LNEKAGSATGGRGGGSFTVTEERSCGGFTKPHAELPAASIINSGKRPTELG
jgi:hypothetical protein